MIKFYKEIICYRIGMIDTECYKKTWQSAYFSLFILPSELIIRLNWIWKIRETWLRRIWRLVAYSFFSCLKGDSIWIFVHTFVMNSFYNLFLGEFWGKKLVPKLKKKMSWRFFIFYQFRMLKSTHTQSQSLLTQKPMCQGLRDNWSGGARAATA